MYLHIEKNMIFLIGREIKRACTIYIVSHKKPMKTKQINIQTNIPNRILNYISINMQNAKYIRISKAYKKDTDYYKG